LPGVVRPPADEVGSSSSKWCPDLKKNAGDPDAIPDALPPPKWRRRKSLRASTQPLINRLRHEVWTQAIRFHGFVSRRHPDAKPQQFVPSIEGALFHAAG
jgi:hypothetical protein